MRVGTYQVFDQVISGTSTTYFTGTEFHQVLAHADFAAIQAYPTSVPNTTTQLTVSFQSSADSQNWVAVPAPLSINLVTLASNVSVVGSSSDNTIGTLVRMNFGAFVRLAITLSGVNPSCRLKLYYTARVRGARA